MARTKQTAHKSSGGRKQLVVKAARSASVLRAALTSHQAVGSVSRAGDANVDQQASYLNHENVLGSFNYPIHRTDKIFHPSFSIGVAAHPQTRLPETWMSVQFSSKLDGPGLEAHGRPSLSLMLVLDISGSMGSPLEGDDSSSDGDENESSHFKSKLDVVKECVYAIVEQLNEQDQVGILLFNRDTYELVRPTNVTGNTRRNIHEKLDVVQNGGGTDLTNGFKKGMKDLAKSVTSESFELQRLMFLTDMESSQIDENNVLKEAASRAKKNLHTTIVGVGVDLSVATVESLSKIPGGKYISVGNAKEFRSVLGMDFSHDVWPIAFDVCISLQNEFSFDRICGSAELNSVGKEEKEFKVSSEFSAPLNDQNEMQGGIFLVKLQVPESGSHTLRLKASWRTLQGLTESTEVSFEIPKCGADLPIALRKALALVRFVDLQLAFCNSKIEYDLDSRKERLSELCKCKNTLQSEMKVLSDDTLESGNVNSSFMETLDRIIALEKKETKNLDRRKRRKIEGDGPSTRSSTKATSSSVQAAFLCPITKQVMKDPVCTCDGHCFERSAIQKWLRTNNKSPMTGMKLENKSLTPNRAIKSMIRELT